MLAGLRCGTSIPGRMLQLGYGLNVGFLMIRIFGRFEEQLNNRWNRESGIGNRESGAHKKRPTLADQPFEIMVPRRGLEPPRP